MISNTNPNIFDRVDRGRSIQLSIESLSRGIDNYHVDVKLSKRFSSDVKKLASLLVTQIAVPNPKAWDNSKGFEKLRISYLDMMTVLIHRVKTDLSEDEICFLQFAVTKHILQFTKLQLDNHIVRVSEALAEHRNKGSSETLAGDQRMFWLKENYDFILFNANKQIFNQIQRVEERQLLKIRTQFLDSAYSFSIEAMVNPLLYTSELSAFPLLLNEFSLWSWNSDDSKFMELNDKVESLLNRRLPSLNIEPLKLDDDEEEQEFEIHDELGGLFLTQPFLGPALDTKKPDK